MQSRNWRRTLWSKCALLAVCVFTTHAFAEAPTNRDLALRLYRRLTGVPLNLADPRLPQIETLIRDGKLKEAAAICTDDANFYRVTLKQWATRMSNRDLSPYEPLNDFSATVIGFAKDNLDARRLLVSNVVYDHPVPPRPPQVFPRGGKFFGGGRALAPGEVPPREMYENLHYEVLDEKREDLRTLIRPVTPQWPGIPEGAGLLTTSTWAHNHYKMGTNRRAVQFALQEFLCQPVESYRETGVADHPIRRDVDRTPAGNAANFQTTCRTCHATLDAMGGAFAKFDSNGFSITHKAVGVHDKMNQNATVYPDGAKVTDDSWETPGTENQMRLFGWRRRDGKSLRESLHGTGIREFGLLLANSERFKTCMAERTFKEICRRAPTAGEKNKEIVKLGDDFEKSGYKLRSLFEDVAVLPACLGQNGDGDVDVGLAHFRQLSETLATATGINPSTEPIKTYYRSALTRFPKNGTAEEINFATTLATTGLSGLYCKALIDSDIAKQDLDRKVHRGLQLNGEKLPVESALAAIDRYAKLFWQREANDDEKDILKQAATALKDERPAKALLVLCTSAASSLESVVR